MMRTQVAIIGAGPSGLLLSQLLHLQGIESVVLERQSRGYVLSRIRAGVLEAGTVKLLRLAGVADRLDREGLIHQGITLSASNRNFRIDFEQLVGGHVVVYGQTEITRDLYQARDALNGQIIHEVNDVTIHQANTHSPHVSFKANSKTIKLDCDFIAGCDGFHGVARDEMPSQLKKSFERQYPFGWLGVLSATPPVSHELIYANHVRGFALCSMRNANLSRYYIQVSSEDSVDNWSDQLFWDELKRRLPESIADRLVTGPSIEMSIAALRSFVVEPMCWGRLFLCGDAAHIVPPTGAKGLNLAASDVYYLSEAFKQYYAGGCEQGIQDYSQKALSRVWKAERFSWMMTRLLHQFTDQTSFDSRIQMTEFDYLENSQAAQASLAENYIGLPY
ncbi:MAG: p-hydroxybenzoate 3-monooxygenase [Gammaproteobacteria bacterium]|jgi:p-hydroxybenzoate 3-monooxygenase